MAHSFRGFSYGRRAWWSQAAQFIAAKEGGGGREGRKREGEEERERGPGARYTLQMHVPRDYFLQQSSTS
jgi:hypothetical protein